MESSSYRQFIRHSDARRHVNKICMAAGLPLVESGTAGYLGQVQPLMKASRSEERRPTTDNIDIRRTDLNASTA